MGFTLRFISKYDVQRWEKLEQRGKIGPRQKAMLEEWRRTNGEPMVNQIGKAILENAREAARGR